MTDQPPLPGLPPDERPPPLPPRDHVWKAPVGRGLGRGHRCEACGYWEVLGAPSWASAESQRPCPGPVSVFVRIDGDYRLGVGEVWPDGDWPDRITAEAVAEVMRKERLESDWDLRPSFFVAVDRGNEVEL